MYFLGSKHKSVIWDRTPPPAHQTLSICVQEGSGITNLQIEINYLNSFTFYTYFMIQAGQGAGVCIWDDQRNSISDQTCLEVKNLQIILIGSTIMRVWIDVGNPHTCTCIHMHTHVCMHYEHNNFMQMDAPLGNP